nr:hypothetical protein [Brachyspira murdochii]
MEFTSQKLLFEKKHPLDIFCKKKNIKREFIVRYKVPMGLIPLVCSMTQSDRVVESTHHITANKK